MDFIVIYPEERMVYGGRRHGYAKHLESYNILIYHNKFFIN